MSDDENKCCYYLEAVSCGDTEEHAHLVCMQGETPTVISNKVIKTTCIGNYQTCILPPTVTE